MAADPSALNAVDPGPPPWAGITEGRIVHLTGFTPGQCTAAIVSKHWGNGCINAHVFGPSSPAEVRTSIAFDGERTQIYAWHWPERV